MMMMMMEEGSREAAAAERCAHTYTSFLFACLTADISLFLPSNE